MDSKFRHPSDMSKKEPREPVSARVKVGTLEVLSNEAKKAGLSVSVLIENVLDDYVKWLTKNAKGKK